MRHRKVYDISLMDVARGEQRAECGESGDYEVITCYRKLDVCL